MNKNPSLKDSEMSYTKEQLVDALVREYEFLCHDDFDPDVDIPPEDYRFLLRDLTIDELIEETSTGEDYSLKEYLEHWA
jgi:hypothetical protein